MLFTPLRRRASSIVDDPYAATASWQQASCRVLTDVRAGQACDARAQRSIDLHADRVEFDAVYDGAAHAR